MTRTTRRVLFVFFFMGAMASWPGLCSAAISPGDRLMDGRDFVYVCRDGGAGAYEAFPDVCRLQDGRLMCVFYAAYDHVGLPTDRWPKGGRIDAAFSSDEGKTWTNPQTLFDGPDDDRDPSIVQLASGRLLCNFFSLRKKAGGASGWDGLGTWLVASDDLGKTWSAPRLISSDYYCSSPIRPLPDGGLILGLYKEDDGKSWGASVRSEDGGMTWGPVVDIPNGGWKLDAETDILPLKDGSLLAVEREPSTSMCFSKSKDGGRTWSVSKPLGFPGHCPYLLRTADGGILLAHRLPQTSLHYSYDEGLHWSENVLVDDFIGAYPSMAALKDGSILIVYYEEGRGSNIRARKFRLRPGGVEWLPFDGGSATGQTIAAPKKDAAEDEGFVPAARLSREGNVWRIKGRRNEVTLDVDSLRLTVQSPGGPWEMRPSFDGDLTLGDAGGKEIGRFRLSAAAGKTAAPYRAGFQAGVMVTLAGFPAADGRVGRRPASSFDRP